MAELQKREKIMVGLAGGALAYFLINMFVCSGDEPEPHLVATKTVEQAVSKEVKHAKAAAKPGPAKTTFASAARPSVSLTNVTWKRDPFALSKRLAPPDTTLQDSMVYTLNGIVWQGGRALALIGNYILPEGGEAENIRVVEIERDRVVCKTGQRVFTLFLEE